MKGAVTQNNRFLNLARKKICSPAFCLDSQLAVRSGTTEEFSRRPGLQSKPRRPKNKPLRVIGLHDSFPRRSTASYVAASEGRSECRSPP
jgi:hypothetical protein